MYNTPTVTNLRFVSQDVKVTNLRFVSQGCVVTNLRFDAYITDIPYKSKICTGMFGMYAKSGMSTFYTSP